MSATEFTDVFASLKEIFLPYAKQLDLKRNDAGEFYLDTKHIMKNKKPMYFGSVKINKKYVSFHLMPVYVFPDLLKGISKELKKRMQGKSCFNFTAIDKDLFRELSELTKQGYNQYEQAGYLE